MSNADKPDLNSLWEQHCRHEFVEHDAAITMKTMIAEPYVNHIPTMTGGYGGQGLYEFYRDHFVSKLPADAKLIPISRTIGDTTLVDEFIFCCTHDCQIDFMLPGIAPTGKYFEVPTVAIVTFAGDKIAHEHIYWDQASVLVQIGLLNPDNLPVAGIETAKKMLDKTLPSNKLIDRSR